jgi:serine phosphatase RsbU (regulator of sigma subunit)
VEDVKQRAFVWSRDDRLTAIIGVALLALLYLARLHSYLLFHTLAEIVFIVVCLSVLVMAWSLRQFLDDDFAVFLGIGLWTVAALQIVHVVDYPGLGLISNSPDPPTQVWLGARLLLAGSFIVATFFIGRRMRAGVVLACFAAYAALLLSSVYWWHLFPESLLEGSGLTPLKKASEYIICLLFLVAIALIWRQRSRLPYQSWRLLLAALVASIAAELWFTLYHSPATWPNMIGHLFLVASALLIFRAVVDDGLARPHALAVTNLREAESMHRRLEQALVPSLPVEHEGLQVLAHYRSGERHLQLSGDFIDVLDRDELGVAVICGDVSGHGPNAAALGAMLRASWQALTVSGAAPVTIVESLRAVLERERKNPLTYATLCLAWIDARGEEVTLLSVAHPAPLLVSGHEVTPLPVVPMPPLGAVDWPVESPLRMALPAGWRLFFYTDGLIEGRAAPGSPERFGEQRLIQAVRTLYGDVVDRESLDRLLADVEAAAGEPFADDVAVILMSQSQAQSPASHGGATTAADSRR